MPSQPTLHTTVLLDDVLHRALGKVTAAMRKTHDLHAVPWPAPPQQTDKLPELEVPTISIAPTSGPKLDAALLPTALQPHYERWHAARIALRNAYIVKAPEPCARHRRNRFEQLQGSLAAALQDHKGESHPAVWMLLGRLLHSQAEEQLMQSGGEIDEALTERAIQFSKRGADARPITDRVGWQSRYDLARWYAEDGRLQEAIDTIKTIAKKPAPAGFDRAEPSYRLGEWYEGQGRPRQAIAAYRDSYTLAHNSVFSGVSAIRTLDVAYKLRDWDNVLRGVRGMSLYADLDRLPDLHDAVGIALAEALHETPAWPPLPIRLPKGAYAVAAQRLAAHAAARGDSETAMHHDKMLLAHAPEAPAAASARKQLAQLSSVQVGRPQMQVRLSHWLSRCSEGRPQGLTLRIDSTLDAAGERTTTIRMLAGRRSSSKATTDCLKQWAPRLLRGMPSIRATIR